MPAAPKAEAIQCRYCECKISKVEETRIFETSFRGKDRTVVRRYRKCHNCGLRFTTIETYEAEDKIGVPEHELIFNNLKVVNQTTPRSPLDTPLEVPLEETDPTVETFPGHLGMPVAGFNPLIHTSPKKETPRSEGRENGSLGKQQARKSKRQ
jgi:hypothetical protein